MILNPVGKLYLKFLDFRLQISDFRLQKLERFQIFMISFCSYFLVIGFGMKIYKATRLYNSIFKIRLSTYRDRNIISNLQRFA